MTTQNVTIAGRPATIQSLRVRHTNKAWGFYNRVIVRFLDNNETHSMGAAAYSKWVSKLEQSARSNRQGQGG